MSATTISASAAAAACCVAIYVSIVRPQLRLPKLIILPQDDDPHSLVYATANDGWRGVWARVRVHNADGRDTAEDVQVMLVDVLTPDNLSVTSLGPLSGRLLQWAGRRSNTVTIPSGSSVRIDLLEYGINADDTGLKKRVCIYPPSTLDSLNSTEFEAEQVTFMLALCGRNINARFYRVDVACGKSWDGVSAAPISMTVQRIHWQHCRRLPTFGFRGPRHIIGAP